MTRLKYHGRTCSGSPSSSTGGQNFEPWETRKRVGFIKMSDLTCWATNQKLWSSNLSGRAIFSITCIRSRFGSFHFVRELCAHAHNLAFLRGCHVSLRLGWRFPLLLLVHDGKAAEHWVGTVSLHGDRDRHTRSHKVPGCCSRKSWHSAPGTPAARHAVLHACGNLLPASLSGGIRNSEKWACSPSCQTASASRRSMSSRSSPSSRQAASFSRGHFDPSAVVETWQLDGRRLETETRSLDSAHDLRTSPAAT